MPRPAPRVAPATRATRPVSGLPEDGFFVMVVSVCSAAERLRDNVEATLRSCLVRRVKWKSSSLTQPASVMSFVHPYFAPECSDAFCCPGDDSIELGHSPQRSHERTVHRHIVMRVEPTFDRLVEQTKRCWNVASDREALAQMERDVRVKRHVREGAQRGTGLRASTCHALE